MGICLLQYTESPGGKPRAPRGHSGPGGPDASGIPRDNDKWALWAVSACQQLKLRHLTRDPSQTKANIEADPLKRRSERKRIWRKTVGTIALKTHAAKDKLKLHSSKGILL